MNIIAPTWGSLESIFDKEVTWVFISSPWFSAEGIEKLNNLFSDERLKKVKRIEIWFRINIEDFVMGTTDYDALLAFAERVHKQLKADKFRLYASNDLHAKVYASDRKVLITSANLTKNGFVDNIEVGIDTLLSASLKNALESFMEEQYKYLDEVSIAKLRSFVKQLNTKTVTEYRKKVLEILGKARKQMSLLTLERKLPP